MQTAGGVERGAGEGGDEHAHQRNGNGGRDAEGLEEIRRALHERADLRGQCTGGEPVAVLRGPRGGMILTNDEAIAKKVNSAIFPGIQGGPLMHVIAGKAVAFGEALRPEFKDYIKAVIENAQAMSDQLIKGGLDTVTGGTDTHVLLVDLRPKGVKGNATEKALGRAHITTNKNGIPFDDEKPTVTSGIRLGSPAGTTRGFGTPEFRQIADWIVEVVDGLAANGEEGNAAVEAKVKAEVAELCARFPLYPNL